MEETTPIRINKYLSEIGYCSRRAADKLIDAGRITVNGNPVEMGMKVTSTDQIAVDGVAVDQKGDAPVYIAFNKPVELFAPPIRASRKTTSLTSLTFLREFFPSDV